MSSHELFSDTMYRQHVIAHIYLLRNFLLEGDFYCDKVRILIPARGKLDQMNAFELMALFERLCELGKTLDPEAVRSVRSTLCLY